MFNVKQKLIWIWQNAERILIILFFATFTLNIRKIFLTPYSFLNGGFNEYTTISFSWADLLILATIVIYTTKSVLRQVIHPYYASLGHGTAFEKLFKNVSRETLLLFFLLAWIGLSIAWSQYWPISTYKFVTILQFLFFSFVAAKYLVKKRFLHIAVIALILNGIFQSLASIAQFIHNGSLGIHFLGESIFGPNIDGVAKIIINGENHIRAYGTLPHPNLLAGFLIIPILLLVILLMFRAFKVSHETFFDYVPVSFLIFSLFVIGTGFFLTFSRSAFLALILASLLSVILVYFLSDHARALSVKLNFSYLTLFVLVTLIIVISLSKYTSLLSHQSINERNSYQIVSYETILSHPVTGVGIGQFVLSEYLRYPNWESWQYQPVHNIYLLILSELGVVGFSIFILLLITLITRFINIYKMGDSMFSLTFVASCCIALSIVIISFIDHYYWDIKIGNLLVAILTIFILVKYEEIKN